MQVTVATKMQHFNELNNFLFFIPFRSYRNDFSKPCYRHFVPTGLDISLLTELDMCYKHTAYRSLGFHVGTLRPYRTMIAPEERNVCRTGANHPPPAPAGRHVSRRNVCTS